jgi:hypothetical protein
MCNFSALFNLTYVAGSMALILGDIDETRGGLKEGRWLDQT